MCNVVFINILKERNIKNDVWHTMRIALSVTTGWKRAMWIHACTLHLNTTKSDRAGRNLTGPSVPIKYLFFQKNLKVLRMA